MMKIETELEVLLNEFRSFSNEFQECMRSIRNVIDGMKEIDGMLSRGEIDKTTYATLKREYKLKIIPYVEMYFDLKDRVKEYRDKLNLILTKVRLDLRDLRREALLMDEKRTRFEIRRKQERILNELMRELDTLENGLDMRTELDILEIYLTSIRDKNRSIPHERLAKYRQHFNKLMNRWSNEKISLTERLEGLEERISEVNDSLRLNEIRFSLGEYDHSTYNEKRIALESKLNEIQNEIRRIQSTIEEMDSRILRCSSLLEELGA